MPILLLLLGVGVFLYLWWVRRDTTLTRACRWRLDRGGGVHRYRCAACGAMTTTDGGLPKDCLKGTLPPA